MDKEKPKMNMPKFNMNWIYGLIILTLALMYFTSGDNTSGTSRTATYSEFKIFVSRGYADRVVANKEESSLKMYVKAANVRDVFQTNAKQAGANPYLEVEFGSVEQLESFLNAEQKAGHFNGNFNYENKKGNDIINILINLSPILFFIILWLFFMRRMGGTGGGANGVFSVGKSKAKMYEKGNELNITFKDVAGQAEAKQEVQEIVEFLKNPKKYTDLGGKIPKGALLVGPPGTGKTLLAKAVAGEAEVPFFSLSGSDFVEMFVGVGASRVRDLFAQAKSKSPCIIFIDEIDAIGRARGKNANMGGNDERENTLNQLLTEMDGFYTNSGIIIMAATNRADILDKALLRAGRFDRQIHVDLPDLNERKEIFMVHTNKLKLSANFDVEAIAKHTPGFSGADIANVCNEAALTAARKGEDSINNQDFADAVDSVVGGIERKKTIMSP